MVIVVVRDAVDVFAATTAVTVPPAVPEAGATETNVLPDAVQDPPEHPLGDAATANVKRAPAASTCGTCVGLTLNVQLAGTGAACVMLIV